MPIISISKILSTQGMTSIKNYQNFSDLTVQIGIEENNILTKKILSEIVEYAFSKGTNSQLELWCGLCLYLITRGILQVENEQITAILTDIEIEGVELLEKKTIRGYIRDIQSYYI